METLDSLPLAQSFTWKNSTALPVKTTDNLVEPNASH